jgi:formate/nitrite transporter FocA (FNT family)
MTWKPMSWKRSSWWISAVVLFYVAIDAGFEGDLPDRSDWIEAAFFGAALVLIFVVERVVLALVAASRGPHDPGNT